MARSACHRGDPIGLIKIKTEGAVSKVTMNRPDRRNAVSDHFITELEAAFAGLPKSVRVVILTRSGRTLDLIQYGRRSVVSAMFGAGLEIAAATNASISEPSMVIQLPEGRRGIFSGGGATVHVGRILGADRMTEMMVTGRKYSSEDGLRVGLSHCVVDAGEA